MKNLLKGNLSRGLLVAKKYAPEILVGTGVVSMVASTVLACKGTLKAQEVMQENEWGKERIEMVKDRATKDDRIEYTEDDEKRDNMIVKRNLVVGLTKAYAPAVITGVLGATCVLSGFGIIRKRAIALAGAYKVVSDSFEKYRSRVIEKYGKDVDSALKNGTIMKKIKKLNSDGEVIGEEEIEVVDPNGYSMYSKIFDEANINWDKAPGYNRMFLQSQQNYANDLLHLRGHLFLNEVYQMLGIPHTKEGALVGWVKDNDGDNFIDFGLFDLDSERARAFINEEERSIVLDFNVDGVIYDLI